MEHFSQMKLKQIFNSDLPKLLIKNENSFSSLRKNTSQIGNIIVRWFFYFKVAYK